MSTILDSNIVIYSLLPPHQLIRDLIAANAPAVSAITLLEVLGFHGLSRLDHDAFRTMFARLPTIDIDGAVLDRAIGLRQQRRMSLGDAIIAGTALVHDRTLVTRNLDDFKWIAGLRLLDPLAVAP